MLRLTSEIQIEDFKFKGVTNVEIDSSWENLTDICKITIPRNLAWKGQKITDLIKRGNKVVVKLGYNDDNKEVFQGYVRDISSKIPVEITCEDGMFLLKKGEIKKSYKSVDTKTICKDIIGKIVNYKVVANAIVGTFRIDKATPAKVLEYLRSNYFIKSWFREGLLYVGLAYYAGLQRERKFDFNQNIIENDLEFRLKDDVRISLKGIIILANNKRKEIPVGDKDGEQRTFHYHQKTEAFVRQQLAMELERLKYTGYRGSFTGFGAKDVRHGDIVDLNDKNYTERNGKYLAKKVVTTFGFSGFRQKIDLESKV